MPDEPQGPQDRKAWLPSPRDFGAKTRVDVGIFLVGAAVGGGLDAVLNVAGFVEPFVFAGLCGAGALGLKNIASGLWRASEKRPGPEEKNG
jgi:hypothetical protein